MKLRKNSVDRVMRGANFAQTKWYERLINRTWNRPVNRDDDLGFRFVIRGKP